MNKPRLLWPSLKRLLIYGDPFRKPITIAVLISWLAAAVEICGPLLVSYFIDNLLTKGHIPLESAVILIIVFFASQIIAAILHYYQTILFNQAAIGVVQTLRTDVMSAAIRQPLSIFDNQPVGQLISRVTNDTEVVKDLFVTVIPTIFRSIALIIAMLVAMFFLEWRMAIVASLIFPIVFLIMVIYQRLSTPIVRRVRTYLADINDGFNEIINGMTVIQQFRQRARFGEKMLAVNRQHYTARMQALKLDSILLRPLLNLFSALTLCGLILLFGFKGIDVIGVGVLYAFINYLGRLNEPLIKLTSQQSVLQQAVVAGERIFELIDSPRQYYGHDQLPLLSGRVDIQKLSFAYRDDKYVLNEIDMQIEDNEFVALVGHTGSGKSTITNLLMGYYPWQEGQILLDGRPLSSLSHQVLRNCITIVQQEPVILATTVFDNIALGREISEQKVWQILTIVQLADWVYKLPNGLNTLLGEQGNMLSTGQKQLLALARALVQTPKILILDEATANVDSGTEKAIQKTLQLIRRQTTLIVIAHRLSTVIDADKIFVLHRGKIVQQGKHNQLLRHPGLYAQMYQLQQIGNLLHPASLEYLDVVY
ncbi:SmdB family multidrug efflux ABC transporter permease/ATP-binding protein [Arsenophonus apicola]|uniref:SmdB family multidrug efflux ABC transporter permease/ATP-binding protein n=1 Tax=Arsenophonus apicola TaxID=2879119 RepID=UPI001CDD283F|nr:SmdB family multidrug efflux ABC transporter permease/ATP-binding protein [Arsenophonus apicola]